MGEDEVDDEVADVEDDDNNDDDAEDEEDDEDEQDDDDDDIVVVESDEGEASQSEKLQDESENWAFYVA